MATTFLTDSFTGSAGTLLTAHTGEVGATWTQPAGTLYGSNNAAAIKLNGSGGAYSNTLFTAGLAVASGMPTGNDWTITAPIHVFSTGTSYVIGIWTQCKTGALDGGYALNVDMSGSSIDWGRNSSAGAASSVSFATAGISAGNTYTATVSKVGTLISYSIGGYLLGVVTDTSPITGGSFGVFAQGLQDGAALGGVMQGISGTSSSSVEAIDSRILSFGYKKTVTQLVCYNIGNDIRFGVSGTTTVSVVLDTSSLSANTADAMGIRLVVDGVAQSTVSVVTPYNTGGTYSLATGLTTGAHSITFQTVYFQNNNNRWTDLLYGIQPVRFLFDAGAVVTAGTPKAKKAVWFTDSLGEYDGTGSTLTEDAYLNYPVLLSNVFGWDHERFGYSGSGYLNSYNPPNPILYDPANAFNWIDSSDSTTSRLVGGKIVGDYIFIGLGTNDSNGVNTDAQITARIALTLPKARSLAQSSTTPIFVIMPPTNDTKRTLFLADYAAYKATDPYFYVIDAGPQSVNNFPTAPGDPTHLTAIGQQDWANKIMPMIAVITSPSTGNPGLSLSGNFSLSLSL